MIKFLVIKYAMVPNKRFSRNFSNKALKIRPYLSCNCFPKIGVTNFILRDPR